MARLIHPPRFRGGYRMRGVRRLMTKTAAIKKAHQTGPKIAEVGIFEDAMYPDDPRGLTVAMVGFWNEYGTPNARYPVPERPFMRRGVAKIKPQYNSLVRSAIKPGLVIDRALVIKAAQLVQGSIQHEITVLRDPPNSPYTVALKGSDNPLIDTGKLRQSITYRITG